jgi:hypothetical protein
MPQLQKTIHDRVSELYAREVSRRSNASNIWGRGWWMAPSWYLTIGRTCGDLASSALEEWLPSVPPLKFEFLFYGAMGHCLYPRAPPEVSFSANPFG